MAKTEFENRLTMVQIGVSAVLAVIGIVLTVVQSRAGDERAAFEQENKRFDILYTLSTKCMSESKAERDSMMKVVAFLSKDDSATSPAQAKKVDLGFDGAKDLCSQLITTRSEVNVLPGVAQLGVGAKPASSPRGATWVYMGTYQNKQWQTRYLTFPPTMDPADYVEGSKATPLPLVKVNERTGALNVRTGSFSAAGEFPPVTRTLPVGRPIRILNTWQWFDSGNWWARIEIPPLKATINGVVETSDQKLARYLQPDDIKIDGERLQKMISCVGADATARTVVRILAAGTAAEKDALIVCLKSHNEPIN